MRMYLKVVRRLSLSALFIVLSGAIVLYAGAEETEDIIVPDTALIDIPTAGILDYYGFLLKTRFFSGGGVVGSLDSCIAADKQIHIHIAVLVSISKARHGRDKPRDIRRTARTAEPRAPAVA